MTQVIILVYRILGAKEQQPPLSPFFNGDLTQTSWRWKDRLTRWFTNSTTSLLAHNVKNFVNRFRIYTIPCIDNKWGTAYSSWWYS